MGLVPDLARAIKEAEPPGPPPPQEPCSSGARRGRGQVFRTHRYGLHPLGGDVIGVCIELVRLGLSPGRNGRRRIGAAHLVAPGGEQMPDEENEQSTKRQDKQFYDAVDQGILVATADSIKR